MHNKINTIKEKKLSLLENLLWKGMKLLNIYSWTINVSLDFFIYYIMQ